MYYGREWSGVTPENFIQHVDAYIRRYNERRIELSLEALSPEMYRRRLRIIILKQSRILAWRERSFGNSRSPSPEYATIQENIRIPNFTTQPVATDHRRQLAYNLFRCRQL